MATPHYKMYINGKFVDTDSGEKITVISPNDESVLGTVPSATVEETRAAIDAATEAEKSWHRIPAPTRGMYLHKLAEEIRKDPEPWIKNLQVEQGKIRSLAETEVNFTADYFDYMAAAGRTYKGEVIQSDNKDETILLKRMPIGVIAGILPWNFPFFLIARKMAPALVTGNTIVLKPSSDTPIGALEFAKLCDKVGIPAGVVNFVTGPGSVVGNELSKNPKIGMASLTGSVSAGKWIMSAAAEHVGEVSLELGGNAPAIVCDDADIDEAVKDIIGSRFDNNGELCNNVQRVYVQEGVADEFMEKLVAGVKAIATGDTVKNPDIGMGPLINKAALEKVDSQVKQAVKEGAKVVVGGKPMEGKGFFYEPTILTNVTQEGSAIQDEIFGPVLPVMTFKNLKDAVEMCNDSTMGLTSGIFTKSLDRAAYAINEIQAGETYVNRNYFEAMQGYHAGVKESGIGGSDGMHGILECTDTKVCYIQRHPEDI